MAPYQIIFLDKSILYKIHVSSVGVVGVQVQGGKEEDFTFHLSFKNHNSKEIGRAMCIGYFITIITIILLIKI